MRALTAAEILTVWERGNESPPAERALLLLSAADDDQAEPAPFARLPIGRRDARLLELRQQLFGAELPCLATCPACGEQLECSLDAAGVLGEPDAGGERAAGFVQVGDHEVAFRLPTAGDLLALSPAAEIPENRLRLLSACLVYARRNGRKLAARDLPEPVVAAVSGRMAELDPQADLQLRLDCPECGHQWDAPFDIASYLWQEIHAAATRLLREVHELASTYGWPEADILALTPPRRAAYLELIRG
jgi:hypothetical protein